MERLQKLLLNILKQKGSFEESVEALVRLVSKELSIERVSVWKGSLRHEGLSCVSLYNAKKDQIEKGTFLSSRLYPLYFRALEKEMVIDASDVLTDLRTSEFKQNYLLPNSILSMLDAPVIIDGEVHGVVCLETVEHSRKWSEDELSFVMDIAQYVGHCFVQEEKRSFEEKYKESVKHHSSAVYVFKAMHDFEENVVDFVLVDLNMLAEEEQQRRMNDLYGFSLREFFPSIADSNYLEKCKHVYREGTSFSFEYSSTISSVHEYYSHLVSSLKDGLIVFNKKITLEKTFKELLNNEKEKRDLIINALPVCFFMKDAQGKYTVLNDATVEEIGKKRDEIIGRTVYDVYSCDEAKQHQYADLKVLRTGKVETYEIRRKKAKGEDSVHLFIKAPFYSSSGEVSGVSGVALDISSQRRAEEQKTRLQAQLLQNSKLTSIGTLATGVSHEINNPLTVCLGFLGVFEELLEEKMLNEGDFKASIKSMNVALERIRVIVKELRTYARSDPDHIEYVDFHEALNSTLLHCRSLFEKENVFVRLELNCSRPLFSGNRAAIQHAIMNILSNARDAIHDSQKGNGEIFVTTRLENGRIVADFIDSGTGISKESITKVFDPFFTTKEPSRGSGLGLSVVQSIVHTAGGEIYVLPDRKEGAAFRIILPLADIVSEKTERDQNSLEHLRQKPRVLLVDDEEDIVDLLKTIFTSWGFDVEIALNGHEGLTKIFNEKKFDLIVSDYRMPGLDGDRMFHEARKRGYSGKSLLLTGLLSDLSAKQIEEISLSVDDVLRMPFDKENLKNILKRLGFNVEFAL